MADRKHRSGLGRGLAALMSDIPDEADITDAPTAHRDLARVPVDQIHPNPDQPRRSFAKEALTELTRSIQEKGVIQPLILRPHPDRSDRYEIVAGERRWRAAQAARLHEVPAVIRSFDDTEALEVAIVENIQRSDLNPIDEAQAYRQLMDRFGHTQDQLSDALGKSRSHIANQTRLLALPEEVQDHLREGRLSAGHARVLVPLDNAAELARKIISGRLSVRQTEALARRGPGGPAAKTRRITKDADTRRLEADLSAATGLKVSIDHQRGGAGKITLRYADLDGLDAICRLLGGSPGE